MSSADGSLHLSAEQVRALRKSLSDCRHNINNCLSLILSAMELVQLKPDSAPKMIKTTVDQAKKVTEELMRYSAEVEHVMQSARSEGGSPA